MKDPLPNKFRDIKANLSDILSSITHSIPSGLPKEEWETESEVLDLLDRVWDKVHFAYEDYERYLSHQR
jgi:hypothetical protein